MGLVKNIVIGTLVVGGASMTYSFVALYWISTSIAEKLEGGQRKNVIKK